MGTPFVSKTIKLTPELDEQIEACMKQVGTKSFTEFAMRALTAEIQLSKARQEAIHQLAAEEPDPYKQKPNAKIGKAG